MENVGLVIREVRKRRGGWPGFEVFVWRRLTSCRILSAMSPEIQKWSRKSRFRINNIYLLTRPIAAELIIAAIDGLGERCKLPSMVMEEVEVFMQFRSTR